MRWSAPTRPTMANLAGERSFATTNGSGWFENASFVVPFTTASLKGPFSVGTGFYSPSQAPSRYGAKGANTMSRRALSTRVKLRSVLAPAAVVAMGAVMAPVLAAAPAWADGSPTTAVPTSTTSTQCLPAGGLTQSLPAQQLVPLEFNQFNPALGTLSGVQVSITGDFVFSVDGTANGANAYNASNDLALVSGPGFTTQSAGSFSPDPPTLLPLASQSNPVPGVPTGDVGIGAASPINHDPVGTPINDVDPVNNVAGAGEPSSFTGYTGTGTVELDAMSDGSMAEIQETLDPATQVLVQVCVAYLYLPAVLPEAPFAVLLPISAAAIGAGGTFLVRRFRHHAAA